jgi:hypothetical protein
MWDSRHPWLSMCHGFVCPANYLHDTPHYILKFGDLLSRFSKRTHDFSKSVAGCHQVDPIPITFHDPSLTTDSRWQRGTGGYDINLLVTVIYIKTDYSESMATSRSFPDSDTCFVIPPQFINYKREFNDGDISTFISYLSAKCTCTPRSLHMTFVCSLTLCNGTTRTLTLPVPVFSKTTNSCFL